MLSPVELLVDGGVMGVVKQSVMEEEVQSRGVTLVSGERGRVLSGFDPGI